MAHRVHVLCALVSSLVACGGRSAPSGDGASRVDLRSVVDARAFLDGEPSFCSAARRTCTLQEYCATLDGQCEGMGVCAPRPTACPENCPGVCGCDGKTYCNGCIANSQGVALSSDGACAAGNDCASNDACAPDSYCHHDGCLSSADDLGECRPRLRECPQNLDPVCGCDGRTYANECGAHSVGVNVAHGGRCEICSNLEGSYDVMLESARSCCAFCDSIQCTIEVKDRLLCGCPTFVDSSNSLEIDEMTRIELRWSDAGCSNSPPCPPFACVEVEGGACMPDAAGAQGSCKDVYR